MCRGGDRACLRLFRRLPDKLRFPQLLHVLGSNLHWPNLDDHFLDLACELVVSLLVVITHGRLAILADVRAFVRREEVALCTFDLTLAHFLAVDEDGACATLAQSWAVISELEPDGRLAGGNSFGRGDLVSLQTEEV